MRKIVFSLATLLFLLLSAPFSLASSNSWLVTKISGTAWIAAKGIDAKRVTQGMALEPGQTLSTQGRTRILLNRGKERMQVGANAILALPPEEYIEPGKTLILQNSGEIQLQVDKKDVRHFAVQTPYLAAVVKGTQFTVSVSGSKASVKVRSGTVGVSSHVSGEETDITVGQSANIDANATNPTLEAQTAQGAKIEVRKSKAVVVPSFVTTVTVGKKVMELSPGTANKVMSEAEAAKMKEKVEKIKEKYSKSSSTNSNAASSASSSSSASKSNNGKSSSSNSSGNNGNGNGNSSSNSSSNNGNGNGNSSSNSSGNNGNGNGNSSKDKSEKSNNGNANGKSKNSDDDDE